MVEMAIVLVIIGLILGGILSGRGMISSMQAKDVVTIADDLRTATTIFRQRYGYLPGDWPYAANTIAGITASPGDGNGTIAGTINANGQAQAGSEAEALPLQLFSAGMIEKMDQSDPQRRIRTTFGSVQVVSVATAAGLVAGFAPAGARNSIVFANLPCDIVREVDSKLDDGNIGTGRAVSALNPCPDGSNALWFAVGL